ncbi:MAG: hypothetical protein JWN10_28 [Solirubrobacterales bacterium]|nr:hypothetical protein [Solirubrobacterales bacterium]
MWPDESIFWVLPAIRAARRAARDGHYDAIVVFMMPYSAGLVGLALRRITGLPLLLNFDDSPTCTDMHPHFPTRLHYLLARALENVYVRRADAVVYVSQTNLDAVKLRQPEGVRRRMHLVRYGADPGASLQEQEQEQEQRGADFQIAYVGAMSGWWALIEQNGKPGRAKRVYDGWNRLGRYERLTLDQRTSSPAVIGAAMQRVIAEEPQWAGRVKLTVYGNPYPPEVVARALASAKIDDVVTVLGAFPHDRVAALMGQADLLFLTLPRRMDGSPGGRISAKTYEYLTTDRPILAAVPRGENWAYLESKPGVWLVDPHDERGMGDVVAELARAKLEQQPLAFDRGKLRPELSYETRAREFDAVIRAAIDRRRAGDDRARRERR